MMLSVIAEYSYSVGFAFVLFIFFDFVGSLMIRGSDGDMYLVRVCRRHVVAM